jgi:serine protease Do
LPQLRLSAKITDAIRLGESVLKSAARIAVVALLASLTLPATARNAPDSFADLADRLSPAVVNISTTQQVERKKGEGDIPWDEFFPDQFQNRKDGEAPESKAPKRRQTSLGSGFIIDKTGYIVTNNHVIEDADQISVILEDDTVLEAKLIGRDEKVDIALLKVESKKELPTVAWGNSNQARVGDWVLAIGNPFGLSGTVTAGIISARSRDIRAGQYDDFIQTDASINRGNSGGPLFNMDGQVVGVNTAIFSPSGGSVGIGFAASANLVRPVLDDLRKYGRTRRGWIGVQIQSVTEEIALSLGLDKARGALVSRVTEKGPALASGIESSDIILSFDGKPIEKMPELPRMVAETAIDKSVDVVLWRKGQQKNVKLKVGELTDGDEKAVASLEKPGPSKEQVKKIALKDLGVTVVEISDATREKYAIPDSVRGLVVVEIDEFSDAALKGIRPGDVIDEMQQQNIGSVADADAAIKRAKDASRAMVLLRITSGGGIRYVAVKMVS